MKITRLSYRAGIAGPGIKQLAGSLLVSILLVSLLPAAAVHGFRLATESRPE